MTTVEPKKITRAEIDAKLADIRDELGDEVADAKGNLIAGATLIVGATIVIAFWLGKRRGRRRSAIIEVKQV